MEKDQLQILLQLQELLRSENQKSLVSHNEMMINRLNDLNALIQAKSLNVSYQKIIHSLASISTSMIPDFTTSKRREFIKKLKLLLLCSQKNKKDLKIWIACIIEPDIFTLNYLFMLSLCIDETKKLACDWKIHLVEIFRKNIATASLYLKSFDSSVKQLTMSMKLFLQMFQSFKKEIADIIQQQDENVLKIFQRISEMSYSIIFDKKINDPLIWKFCASIIAFMLNYHEPQCAYDTLQSLFVPDISPSSSHFVYLQTTPMVNISIERIELTNENLFWIIFGVLSCCPNILFHGNQSFALLEKAFLNILECCKSTSKHQYHGCVALELWWKQFSKLSKSQTISSNINFVQSTWDFIKSSWDSQVTGLVDILMQIYSTLLDVLILTDKSKVVRIISDLVAVSDSVKGKYGPLCISVQKFGHEILLDIKPSFVCDLLPGLGVNHFASIVSKVYKAIAISAFKKSGDNFDLQKWEKLVGIPLVDALLSSSFLIHQNALSYWLPVNLNLHSTVFPRLLYLLKTRSSYARVDDICTSAQIGVLQTARYEKIIGFKEMDLVVVNQAFSSLNNTTRRNAFWLVCKVPKKTEPISDQEFALMRNHLPMNMNMDFTAFRYELISAVRYFLERLCSSISTEENQGNSVYAASCMNFLSYLLGLCKNSLHKSFTYQRKITALSIYKNMLHYFSVQAEDAESNLKEKSRTIKQILMQYDLNLVSPSIAKLLLPLAEDVVCEVRETSLFLLSKYYPTKAYTDLYLLVEQNSEQFLSSPKAQDSESGALLKQFYLKMFLLPSCDLPLAVNLCRTHEHGSYNYVSLLHSLLTNLKSSFSHFQRNFLDGALHSPMHGRLLALSMCLDQFVRFISTRQSSVVSVGFCFETEAFLNKVLHFMLSKVFSCTVGSDAENKEYLASADFQEISNRVMKIISNFEGCESDDILLSHQFETVMSASWLSLKNSCSCLSSVGCLMLQLVIVEQKNLENWFEGLCRSFVSVLSMCRHSGVLESSYLSFVKYLTNLFNSKFHHIPVELLWSHLKTQGRVHHVVEGGTITRRSAGIPLVVDAILTAYFTSNRKHETNLLSDCIDKLLLSLEFLSDIDEKLVCASADLPQVDALYILKRVLQNNQLAPHVFPHLTTVFISAIRCLDSSLWVVRNAATHLSGMFAARMLGQKHIENDEATSLSAYEFFARFPKLFLYFQELFQNGLYLHTVSLKRDAGVQKSFLKPSVFIIISLLAKLNYGCCNLQSDQFLDYSFVSNIAQQLLTCSFHSVRTTSAKLLIASSSFEDVLLFCSRFLNSVPLHLGKETDQLCLTLPQNTIHGWLLAILSFIKRYSNHPSKSLTQFHQLILSRKWLCDPGLNPCPQTAALYLQVLAALYKRKQVKDFEVLDLSSLINNLDKSLTWIDQAGYLKYAKCLAKLFVLCGLVVTIKNFLFKPKHRQLLQYCLKYIEKYSSNIEINIESILTIIVRYFETSEIRDLSTEISSISLFVSLKDDLRISELNDLHIYNVLSVNIFSIESVKSLSLRCLLIRAMSVLIAWEINQELCSDNIKQHLRAWMNELKKATFLSSASEPLRSSAADSIRILGRDALIWVKQHDFNLFDFTSSLCYCTLLFLHDEQSDTRRPVCQFVATLCDDNDDGLVVPHHYCATQILLAYFSANFPSTQLLDSYLTLCISIDVPRADSCLYQQEAFNLYVEIEQLALFIRPHIKTVSEALIISPQWVKGHLSKCEHLLTTCDELVLQLGWDSVLRFGMCCLVYTDAVLALIDVYSSDYDNLISNIQSRLLSLQVNVVDVIATEIKSLLNLILKMENLKSISSVRSE